MVTTIVACGPYYTACHIPAIKSGETNIPISNYRYFGGLAFCQKWQAYMKKVGLETTDEEIWCLFLGIDPKDSSTETTINISAEPPIGKAVVDWESQPSVELMATRCVPMPITQLSNDQNVSGLGVGMTYPAGQLVATIARGSDIALNLEFPDIPPPQASTHLHRYYCTRQFGMWNA